jgi:putative ABC transport system ATP-binding protein
MPPILECVEVRHTFGRGELAEEVLRGVSASFEAGQACVLMGPSGSGKTTLLSILGCLLTPTFGQVVLEGRLVDHAARGSLCRLRRDKIGFVFQNAQLLPFLTVAENLRVVGYNAGLSAKWLDQRVGDLLERLGIAATRDKRPEQLSGGERQRVAVARALLHRPLILLADEPTASLDWRHGEAAVRFLVEQSWSEGSLLLTVTHDARLRPMFDRCLRLTGGRLEEGEPI